MATATMAHPSTKLLVERQSLCLSGSTPGVAIHAGENEFRIKSNQYFRISENNTAERLVAFKNELSSLGSDDEFWNHLMEGLASICGAQFAFVSKRILRDDHNLVVEMPSIGEKGSCLMGVALYWDDGNVKDLQRDYKYYAWDAPCSYMRHDKVFLVPEGLSSFVTDNPNQMPFECDAYLGIPLFADGKCFAHFGVMWTKEGLEQKKDLSWGYLEMMMHSLEDLITNRLIAGRGFAKINDQLKPNSNSLHEIAKVIPQHAITAAQSLKPYARSLSHELRTPMQGVVGMLDVMHATVQEQLELASTNQAREIFRTLKRSIETVQDSSKRAVEAADNVVQAYDLNMQIPETPSHDVDSPSHGSGGYFDARPRPRAVDNPMPPFKRRRSSPNGWEYGTPHKIRHLNGHGRLHTPSSRPEIFNLSFPPNVTSNPTPNVDLLSTEHVCPPLMTPADTEGTVSPGFRQSVIRDLIPLVIHDSLRVGGRPDSAVTEPTSNGERIEVRSRSSNGQASQNTIIWSVNSDVPEAIQVDERDVSKLISAVLLNAIKFTEDGVIKLHVRLSTRKKFIVVRVTDTGSGIPAVFQPELFKPFSKEDHSITRSKEGLGLGLLVAKGTARRLGGDLTFVKSSTDGTEHGSEFEIRIPTEMPERLSRPATPSGDPSESVIEGQTVRRRRNGQESQSPFVSQSPIRPNDYSHSPSVPRSYPKVSRPETTSSPSPPSSKPIAPSRDTIDRALAAKHPLRILVAEDNKINRKLLVNMLSKFGYQDVYEAFDGKEAVRIMEGLLADHRNGHGRKPAACHSPIDVILMDLWMPEMDGYEATERILGMFGSKAYGSAPVVLAVSADVTEAAVDRATKTGMKGYMAKPYKLIDLQKLILEFCALKT